MYEEGGYSREIDVFSFALIVYEVLVGTPVFPPSLTPIQILARVVSGKRADIPATVPPFLTSLITRCWSGDPSRRPGFDDIFDELTEIDFQILPNVHINVVRTYADEILAWESKLPPFPY
jgi:mitogen-activated protein kinase kinase kinase 7